MVWELEKTVETGVSSMPVGLDFILMHHYLPNWGGPSPLASGFDVIFILAPGCSPHLSTSYDYTEGLGYPYL